MSFIVMTASAKMPISVKSKYKKVAVVEVYDPDIKPKMISNRANNVRRVVELWDRLHAGSHGGNTAYDRALRAATAIAEELNEETKP